MNQAINDIVRDAIMEQACAWQARLLGGELTAGEKIEFLKWLQDSPHHVREYLNTARVAKLMPRAFQGLQVTNVVALNSTRGKRCGRFLPALAAAVIACIGVYTALQYWGDDTLQVSVPHGDQRTVRLQDGSVMLLNSESQARVRYSESERLIELTRGQALFSVAQDKQRPFRVRAGSTEVVALGTQFDVFRRPGGDLTVTVVEGKVAVAQQAPSSAKQPLTLTAGEQVRIGAAIAQPTVAKVDAHVEIAWVRREIVFNGRPLGEVAEEFNRYLSVPVVIDDAALGRTRVSGIFSAYDEEAFLAFLREFDGVQVEVGPSAIRVRGR